MKARLRFSPFLRHNVAIFVARKPLLMPRKKVSSSAKRLEQTTSSKPTLDREALVMPERAAKAALALDDFDRALLDHLQTDATLTHAQLGERVHLSASSVRRRIERMRAQGVIEKIVALLGTAMQTGVTVIVTVSFAQESLEIYRDFRQQMRADSNVRQCYSVAGSEDFVLLVNANSPADYEKWGERALMSNASIRRYSSQVVWSTVKFSTALLVQGKTGLR
jgi:Lrp/AsnC family transcriptional regulator, leucine-responsive regulatory protein